VEGEVLCVRVYWGGWKWRAVPLYYMYIYIYIHHIFHYTTQNLCSYVDGPLWVARGSVGLKPCALARPPTSDGKNDTNAPITPIQLPGDQPSLGVFTSVIESALGEEGSWYLEGTLKG